MKPEAACHLFVHHTLLGKYPGTCTLQNNRVTIGGHEIELVSEIESRLCPWKRLKIEWVVESSGAFTNVIRQRNIWLPEQVTC